MGWGRSIANYPPDCLCCCRGNSQCGQSGNNHTKSQNHHEPRIVPRSGGAAASTLLSDRFVNQKTWHKPYYAVVFCTAQCQVVLSTSKVRACALHSSHANALPAPRRFILGLTAANPMQTNALHFTQGLNDKVIAKSAILLVSARRSLLQCVLSEAKTQHLARKNEH